MPVYQAGRPYREAGVLASWVLSLLEAGKFTEAESIARECFELREVMIPDHWLTFNAKSMLGGALLGQKKYAEAGPLLLSGYEGLKQREDQIPATVRQLRVKEALERLMQFYEATGQTKKAAGLKSELDELNSTASP